MTRKGPGIIAGIAPTRMALAIAVAVVSVVGAASLVRGVGYLVRLPDLTDLPQFYVAAQLLRMAPGVSIYDAAAIAQRCAELGIPKSFPPNYPAFAVLLFYPLSLLPYQAAKAIWLLLNAGLLSVVPVWAWRRQATPHRCLVWIALWLVLLLPNTTETLLLGQVNIVLGCLLLAVIEAARRRKPRWDWIAGIPLGLAVAFKLWPLVLCGYFLMRRRFRIVLSGLLTSIVLTGVGAIAAGPSVFWSYFARQLPGYSATVASSGYALDQGIWSVAARLFLGGTTPMGRLYASNVQDVTIQPLLVSGVLYWLVVVAFVALTVGALVYSAWRLPARDALGEEAGYWAVLAGLLTVLPFSWAHYAFLLVFPVMTLFYMPGVPIRWSMAFASAVLFLTLLQRFYAWLPLHPLFMGFTFLAEVLVEAGLLAYMNRSWLIPRYRRWRTPGRAVEQRA